MKIDTVSNLQNRNHIPGLDALRMLAIAGVTLFHIFPGDVPGGYMGVTMFLVLSGYLLAYTCERARRAGRFSLPGYFGRRLRRIYPSLIIMILTTVGVYSLWAPEVVGAVRPEALSVLLGYNNWWQIAQQADYFTRISGASPFTHLWFLGVELQYYLIWPLLFGLYVLWAETIGRKAGVLFLAVLALGAAVLMPLLYHAGMDVTRLYYGTDTRAYALLFGAVLGLWEAADHPVKEAGILARAAWTGSFFGALAAFVFVFLLMDGQNPLVYQGGMLLVTLLFCLFLKTVTDRRLGVGAVLEDPLCKWVGRHSYDIFLWQYPVIFLFVNKGWDKLAYGQLMEIAVICLLAVWSRAMSAFITRAGRLPLKGRLGYARFAAFCLVSLVGLSAMSFGFYGLAESAGEKPAGMARLQSEMEKKAAVQAADNRQAAAAEAARKQAEEQRQEGQAAPARQEAPHGVACVGDSVLLGASLALRQEMPDCYIDAEVSRYVGGGIEAFDNLASHGMMGDVVLVALGTNGPIAGAERYEEQTRALMKYLGPKRRIFWVNIYAPHLDWQDTNNAYLQRMAKEYPNLTVIDWYSLASRHPEWLTEDGVHPDDTGAAEYARLVCRTMAGVLSGGGPGGR